MNYFQHIIPEYRRTGLSLLAHAIILFTKNTLPIFVIVAIMTLPVEAIKTYFVDQSLDDESLFSSTFRIDSIIQLLLLGVVTIMVVYYILGRLNGGSVGILQSIRFGIRKWPKMVMYSFLLSLCCSSSYK